MKKETRFIYRLPRTVYSNGSYNLREMLYKYRMLTDMLSDWKDDGIQYDPEDQFDDDYHVFYTFDEDIAEAYDFFPDIELGDDCIRNLIEDHKWSRYLKEKESGKQACSES